MQQSYNKQKHAQKITSHSSSKLHYTTQHVMFEPQRQSPGETRRSTNPYESPSVVRAAHRHPKLYWEPLRNLTKTKKAACFRRDELKLLKLTTPPGTPTKEQPTPPVKSGQWRHSRKRYLRKGPQSPRPGSRAPHRRQVARQRDKRHRR